MTNTFKSNQPVKITEVVLRDAHQSLFATRLRLDDILPIAAQLDDIGFHTVEAWGGATFDACIRFLGEDPWFRLREIKKLMPKTPLQMLLRGQNLLGYRHYADDLVVKFVERCYSNGIEVFRIFDAHNDVRNLTTAINAANKVGAHAQGTLSYTTSPVHNIEGWVSLAKQLEEAGAQSICIKDMAGLLRPYKGYELVTQLKKAVQIPIFLHSHATTGFSCLTILKCIEAGIDGVDTAISAMSMTYGHSATETIVSSLEGSVRESNIDFKKLLPIAEYFRAVRPKYAKFEGSLKGIDPRIIDAQVPGGMLTNMESQLRDQGAADKFDAVLKNIPKVRKDLGYLPLVTPSSQIIGTQAVLNVLSGEDYKVLSKESELILQGKYGSTPAPVNAALQKRALGDAEPVTVRPADLLKNELETLTAELETKAKAENITLETGDRKIDDIVTYALFPQVGLNFLKNRNNPSAFEPVPTGADAIATSSSGIYDVEVDGKVYKVKVDASGEVESATSSASSTNSSNNSQAQEAVVNANAEPLKSPLAGSIIKVLVNIGDKVVADQPLIVIEAMKMETEVSAVKAGVVATIAVAAGDKVQVGDILLQL